jgi:hypothetical protein
MTIKSFFDEALIVNPEFEAIGSGKRGMNIILGG